MNLSKEQARRVAQLLYPQLWTSNRVEAVAKAIDFIADAAQGGTNDVHPSGQNSTKPTSVVARLADQMRQHKLHVNVVSQAIGVSAYTVRTWIEGKYQPNEDNAQKIADFLKGLHGDRGLEPALLPTGS
jgi:hypothetical protein